MNAPIEWLKLAECPQCIEGQKTPVLWATDETKILVQTLMDLPDGTHIAHHLNFEIGKQVELSFIDRKVSPSTKEYIHAYNLKSENKSTSKVEIKFQPYNSKECILLIQWQEYLLKTNHELLKRLREIKPLPVYTETKDGWVRLIAIQ